MSFLQNENISIKEFGSHALLLNWEFKSDFSQITQIHVLANLIRFEFHDLKIEDIIPASNTLTIVCRSIKDVFFLKSKLLELESIPNSSEIKGTHHDITVDYHRLTDPEILEYLEERNLNTHQLQELHSSQVYRVFFMGFLPGFAYVGGLPEQLHIKRKEKPALKVHAGSVAIADQFTAIYPQNSPGGWHIIGTTSFPLFDKKLGAVLSPFDTIQFRPSSNIIK